MEIFGKERPLGGVPCIHLIFLQLRRNSERISTGNLQRQKIRLYQVPVIPHDITNRLFKVVSANAQHHGDLGEVEKYYRVALPEIAFLHQSYELATSAGLPTAGAPKGLWEARVEQILVHEKPRWSRSWSMRRPGGTDPTPTEQQTWKSFKYAVSDRVSLPAKVLT